MLTVNKRVLKDINEGMKNLKEEFGIYIAPEENDYYKVHFIIPGPEDTSFEGGLYHGMIRLNNDHPLRAPNIHMVTPNGRFEVEKCPIPPTSRGICTTATAFHPESWTPVNNIESVLKGFISLMCDPYDGGIGSIQSSPIKIKQLAKESINHLKSDPIVKELFHELYDQITNGEYIPVKLSKLKPLDIKKPIKSSTVTTKSSNNKKKYFSEEDTSEEELLESSDDSSSEENVKKRKPRKKTVKKKISSEEDTSEEELLESSSESSDEEIKKRKSRKPIKNTTKSKKIPKDVKKKNTKTTKKNK
ncbi:enzyme E2 [Moumouvirus australiensis]|uniref:E2 ubiquitin-conjugating enzyme n=1 Tax=Moumouvirus australiensis TaxID=2109587 RepID=A0A2P1EL25_9VIRU|nr:enzyme E2 [Moumouvirus australiensis]AVL94596.1 enzyme E2 [Moumouvirus australiensis]